MPFTEGTSPTPLNGTTDVDVVAAPAASTRRLVRSVVFHNADTVERTVVLSYDDNGTPYILGSATIEVGGSWVYDTAAILDTTTRKLTAVCGEATTTNEVTAVAAWGDAT